MASPLTRLYEHPDFKSIIAEVARLSDVSEAWIEKDSYLTEALRCLAALYPTQATLKGGTSLSKGWQLLDRISEDIDLFVDPYAFPPPTSGCACCCAALASRPSASAAGSTPTTRSTAQIAHPAARDHEG